MTAAMTISSKSFPSPMVDEGMLSVLSLTLDLTDVLWMTSSFIHEVHTRLANTAGQYASETAAL